MAFDAGKAVAYLTLDTSQYEQGLSTAGKLLKQLSNNELSAGAKIGAIGDAIGQTGKILTTTVTSAVAALGTVSVKTFASYDDAMKQVQATMNASAEEVAMLSAKAKEMGVSTRYSATNAAEALNYLALAGYDANQACEALPQVLALAQAGGLDLAYASDLATDAMSALGLGIKDLTGFTDQMAKTSQKSNTNVAQLGEAILTVGGTAKTLAGGTAELNTQLGILADNGIKGAEGGTKLRNIILSLTAPTDQAAKVMKQYGLQVYDAAGNLRGTNEIFQDLDGILGKLSGPQRAEVLNDLFNKADLKGVEALLSNCRDRYDELYRSVENSAGATKQMADTMESGIGGTFRSLASAAEGAALAFGESLVPTVQTVTEFITRLTRSFAELPAETQRTVGQVALIAAAAGPVLIAGSKLISMAGTLTAVMSGPAGWVTLGVAGVAALAVAMSNLESSAEHAAGALQRSTKNIDPQEAKDYADAFANIDLDVDVDATKAENKIAAAWTSIGNALKKAPLTDAQIAEINSLIGQGYQKIYDKLVEFGLPEGTASELATQLAGAGEEIATAFDSLNVGASGATIAKWALEAAGSRIALRAAAKSAGLSEGDIQEILGLYDQMTGQVTDGLPNIVDEIYTALTDGKKDDKGALLKLVTEGTQQAFADIDAWLQNQISALDSTSSTYAEDIAALEQQAADWKAEVTALDGEMRGLVEGLANQPSSVVNQRLAEFEALEARAQQLAGQLDEVNARGRALDDQNVQLVRAGAADDSGTVAGAFEATGRNFKLNKAAIEQEAEANIQAARDAWSEAYAAAAKLPDAGLREAARAIADEALEQTTAAETARRDSEIQNLEQSYQSDLQALFAGLAKRNPEIAAQLAEQMDITNILADLNAAIEHSQNPFGGGLESYSFAEETLKALFDFSGMDLSQLSAMGELGPTVMALANQLEEQATTSIEGMDTGSIGLAFQGMLESGMLEGTGIDVGTIQGQLNLILGGIDASEGGKAAGESGGSGVTSGLNSKEGEVKAAGTGLAGAGAGGADDSSGYKTAGQNAGAGYAKGLRSKIPEVRRAASALAAAGRVSVATSDDSHSPSRKYMQLGGFGGAGYAKGLREKLPEVRAAAAEMVSFSLAQPISRASQLAANGTAGVAVARDRAAAGAAAGATVQIDIKEMHVRNDRDIDLVAQKLGDYINNKNYL